MAGAWLRPETWLLLPAVLPVIGLAPWSGWITFEELDMLVLACAAGGYARLAWPGRGRKESSSGSRSRSGASILPGLLSGAFVVSILLALERGFADAGGFHFGWYQGYLEPMNSIRLAKPFLLALLMLPLWQSAWRRDPDHASRLLMLSITAGLALASLSTIWERYAFTGLTDFSSDYRTTGLFWEMHVGGAALDGFLALATPFAVLALMRCRSHVAAAPVGLALALATYACLTTFSRGAYLAIPSALVLVLLLTKLQRSQASGATGLNQADAAPGTLMASAADGKTSTLIIAALVAGYSLAAFWMFQGAGYRGMAALLGCGVILLPLVGRMRGLPAGTWLSGAVLGALLSTLALAVGWLLPKGPYLAWGMAATLTGGALWLPHKQRATAQIAATTALGGFLALLVCTGWVAWHWGGKAGLVAAFPALLGLVGVGAAACTTSVPWWPGSRKAHAAIVGLTCVAAASIAVLGGGAFMSNRFSTGERDLGERLAHWRLGSQMLLSPIEWLLGKGLGRFPANYALIGDPGQHPGGYRLGEDAGKHYLTLTSGLHANGWGELFRVTQRVGEPGPGATVTAQARSSQAATLHFEVCEKHLLYGQNCIGRDVAVKALPGTWQPLQAELRGTPPTRGDWFAPRIIAFSVAVDSRGGQVDIDKLQLRTRDGRPMLANDDFSQEMAHWFFSSDKYHLPWHMKNMFLHLTFDQGLLGAALFTLLLGSALWRTTVGAARKHALAPALAASLSGFATVGLFDSLLDVPRVAWLYYALMLIALVLPRTGGSRVRASIALKGAASLAFITACSVSMLQPAPAIAADASQQSVLQVGPEREIRSLAEASRLARDGATIEVDAGEYLGDVAVWTQNNLTLRAVGGRVVLKAQRQAAEAKAIWVLRGGTIDVEGFDFREAQVPDHNGAGIRLETGRLRVRDCRFIDNENGILTSNRADVELDIVDSEFGHNGYGDGQSHDLYVGAIARLSVTGSYFHHAIVGHLLKSRAARNDIRYNRLADEPGGRASYELEFPNGGVAIVVGNVIAQEATTENPNMVSYGAEGYRWPANALLLVHNTLVDRRAQGGVFLKVRPGDARITAVDNLLVGSSTLQAAGPGEYRGNAATKDLDVFEPGTPDSYRVRRGVRTNTPLADPGEYEGVSLVPRSQFRFPRGTEPLRSKASRPGAVQ